jgi:hypothetical protein
MTKWAQPPPLGVSIGNGGLSCWIIGMTRSCREGRVSNQSGFGPGNSGAWYQIVDRGCYDFWSGVVRHMPNVLEQNKFGAWQRSREGARVDVR